jgi:plastocyanin
MVYRTDIYIIASLIVSGIFSVLPIQVFADQIIDERKFLIHTVSVEDPFNATSTASSNNNTIILNAAEVREEEGENETAEQGKDETAEQGKDEAYRWADSTGAENPDLNITSNTEYTIKIDNPTDEEHQLIIDSASDGKTSKIGQSDEIKPGKNVEFKFKTDQVGELGYHCKYHPDMMNGTINVS